MTTVMLVDDHAVVREGYRRLLESAGSIDVVGECSTGSEAYLAFARLFPDVVVMDVSLPDYSGIEAVRRILARHRDARILMFSVHEEAIFPRRAFQAGALGYITKASAPAILVEAVRLVARGERYLGADVARVVALDELVPGDAAALARLSTREFEVMRLLAAGVTVEGIAARLNLQAKTVANHQSSIRQKLGIRNPLQLADIARRAGLRNNATP